MARTKATRPKPENDLQRAERLANLLVDLRVPRCALIEAIERLHPRA
jgi:hypothetical protein